MNKASKSFRCFVVTVSLLSPGCMCSREVNHQAEIENYGSGASSNRYGEIHDASPSQPENPYSYESGHYAGYEWARDNNVTSCGGNSDSFIEGCEEYLREQEAEENTYDNGGYEDM